MPKSEFWQRSSPHFSNLAKNSPKLLKIGGKVAKICSIFWRKITTSGHSDGLLWSSCKTSHNTTMHARHFLSSGRPNLGPNRSVQKAHRPNLFGWSFSVDSARFGRMVRSTPLMQALLRDICYLRAAPRQLGHATPIHIRDCQGFFIYCHLRFLSDRRGNVFFSPIFLWFSL